ncbi:MULTISPECIES: hypothetical protein [unclassified Sinorhizobium]|uniref:hypothetical protein n=1 Tax=unclassified Sinorhizobium TaxID=2613772 RepID=UPI0035262CAB
MFSRGGFDAKRRRRRLRGADATSGAVARPLHADPAKALVMACFDQIVADGFAEWMMLDNGDIQLRFNTGETFVLTETVIIRLA